MHHASLITMKQSRLPFTPSKRKALGEVSGNVDFTPKRVKRGKSCIATVDCLRVLTLPDTISSALPPRTMASELATVTREQARLTVERLIAGYADKSGSSYSPALSNEAGCILAQKAPNRAVSNMLPCYRASTDADFTILGEWLHPDRAAGLWAKDKSRQE